MPWLRLRGAVYWCRFAISSDLAGREVPERWPRSLSGLVNPKTGRIKVEFTESLGQRTVAEAERAVVARKAWFDEAEQEAARFLSGQIEPLQEVTANELAALAEAVKSDILAGDEALRRHGLGLHIPRDAGLFIGESPPAPPFKAGDGLTEDDLGLMKHISEQKRAQLGRALAMARPDSDTLRRASEVAEKAGDLPQHRGAARVLPATVVPIPACMGHRLVSDWSGRDLSRSCRLGVCSGRGGGVREWRDQSARGTVTGAEGGQQLQALPHHARRPSRSVHPGHQTHRPSRAMTMRHGSAGTASRRRSGGTWSVQITGASKIRRGSSAVMLIANLYGLYWGAEKNLAGVNRRIS
jgi:hypothetical protein